MLLFGHIHVSNFSKTENIIYPGSTLSYSFKDEDIKGMVYGEFIGDALYLEKIPLDDTIHRTIELDISNFSSEQELINNINDMDINENDLVRIYFTGHKNFEVNDIKIKKYIEKENILEIIDNSSIKEDLNEIKNEFSLKGIFVKERLEKIEELENTKNEITLRIKQETDPSVIKEKEKLVNELEKEQRANYKAIEIVLQEMNNM